jgi:hypothetical protein
MHVNVSSVWKEIDEAHVNVSGTWKELTEGWVNVSGTWKQFYEAVELILPASMSEFSTDPQDAAFLINRDGTCNLAGGGAVNPSSAFDWIDPKSATVGDAWEVKVDVTGGSFSGGSAAVGSWLALSSNRLWQLTTVGTVTANVSIGVLGTSTALIKQTLTMDIGT